MQLIVIVLVGEIVQICLDADPLGQLIFRHEIDRRVAGRGGVWIGLTTLEDVPLTSAG